MKKKKKLAIFIDGNNFRHGLKALLKSEHIDWKTFMAELKKDYQITQATYYIGKITAPLFDEEMVAEQEELLKKLKAAKIEPWLGYFNDDKSEKGVDVQIALDMAVGATEKKYEVVLLISGDGDLSNAIKICQEKKVEVLLGTLETVKKRSYRISWILKELCDDHIALDDIASKAHEKWKASQKKSEKKPAKKTSKKTTAKKKTPAKKTKKEKHLLVFSDGGSRNNPGPSGCGAAITDTDGKVLKKISQFIGIKTNNQAEYFALLMGLDAADQMGATQITCYLDSKLVVEQVCKRWKVKNKDLKEYYEQVQIFLMEQPNVSFHHIPREKNKLADQLANEAMDRGK